MEALFIVLAVAGACGLAFATLGFVGEILLPALTRKPYRPAATRRVRQ